MVRTLPRRSAVALAITMALAAAGADAATITVASTADGPIANDGTCTLREAIASLNAAANAGGCTATGAYGAADAVTITATGTLTLDPAEGPLFPEVPSTITGPGAAQLTISGGNETAVFYSSGPGVTLQDVTIANGYNDAPGAGGAGVFLGSLTLRNCTLSGNFGGYGSAALAYAGELNIDNCTITGNTGVVGGAIALLSSVGNITGSIIDSNESGSAQPDAPQPRAGHPVWRRERPPLRIARAPEGGQGLGGAISVFGDFGKGGDESPAPAGTGGPLVTISRTSISGNSSGILGGALFLNYTSALITESTISGNTAGSAGGAVFAGNASLGLVNSTISGNGVLASGDFTGGGALLLYAPDGAVPVDVLSTTITGNVGNNVAGGVLIDGPIELFIESSILANSGGTAPADIGTLGSGAAIDATNSLVENPGNSGITPTGGNIVGSDPLLGPLANNGGPTLTHLPATGSPVLDAGSNPTGAEFDQRGAPFARVVGPAADIGSVEVPAGGPVPSPSFVANVPTTTTWGALLLAGALAAMAWFRRLAPARRRARRNR